MRGLIVITGLDQLAPAQRWPRLINPLAIQLGESGLGELPDLEVLRHEFHQTGCVDAAEVAIRLVNLEYGKELVNGVVAAAGLERRDIIRPERWRPIACDDYYASEHARQGCRDEQGQFWYLERFDRVFENEEAAFLDVGGTGADGVRFGYRRGHRGFWAYPVVGEYVFLADSVDSFIPRWLSGELSMG